MGILPRVDKEGFSGVTKTKFNFQEGKLQVYPKAERTAWFPPLCYRCPALTVTSTC